MMAATPKTSRLGVLPPTEAEELVAWRGGRSNGSGLRLESPEEPALGPVACCDDSAF
jgi:hypothetical protein